MKVFGHKVKPRLRYIVMGGEFQLNWFEPFVVIRTCIHEVGCSSPLVGPARLLQWRCVKLFCAAWDCLETRTDLCCTACAWQLGIPAYLESGLARAWWSISEDFNGAVWSFGELHWSGQGPNKRYVKVATAASLVMELAKAKWSGLGYFLE